MGYSADIGGKSLAVPVWEPLRPIMARIRGSVRRPFACAARSPTMGVSDSSQKPELVQPACPVGAPHASNHLGAHSFSWRPPARQRYQSPSYRLVPGWAPAPGGARCVGAGPGPHHRTARRVVSGVFRRRGAEPIVELDSDEARAGDIGRDAFIWPHGLRVDRDGFLWIADGRARDGRGQQVWVPAATARC